ncbi:sensor histidine kinase [Paenibacillus sediminis]|uniref:histidine kinase n=1 Tax=Paenibacillus sediminis TaxID=664909 RepID=A0ABS4GZT6_9BACL|nr:sensor histidine kinase [Paenibacillus sediminis]MBP1935622.1 sensor histidine kinase YesM [Paenibacillus sediminis]
MNLRLKLFTAFLALIIIPLFVLGIVTFLVTYYSIEEKYSQQAEYSLKAISYSITNVFNEMNNVTDNGIATAVFEMALSAKDPENQDLTDADQLNLNANQRNFRTLLYNHPAISYAFLYNFKGKGQSSIVSIFTKENFKTLPFDEFKKHPLYEQVMKLNGLPKWLAPHEYPELTGSEPVFTQIRLVKELSYFRNVGILVVQVKNWEFEKIFRNLKLSSNMQDTRFLLVNDEGLILYDHTGKLDSETIQSHMNHSVMFKSGYQSFRGKFDGQESIISVYHLKEYPWSLVSVASWHSLSQEIRVIAVWFIVITSICLLAAILFNLIFMNRITGYIGVIVRFMRKVEDGDLHVRVETKGNDELHLLAEGFNNLMDKMNQLFRQVKCEQDQKNKAELRVLQAQIKPHFLFNTLESINALAVQNEGKKVSQMVYRLASILRISIQGNEEITIIQELEHLNSYLEIQKFRFEDLFDYEIDIHKELYNHMILKLTLQPLVENSIQHGFEGIPYRGKIRITGYAESDRILLRIEDNGIGMSSEQLKVFQYMVSEEHEKANQERRGLGIRSVADRLRIHYGERYGLFICSHSGEGTIIQIVIPKYEWGGSRET